MAATTRLLVKEAFPGHAPGDRITDAAEMKRIQATYPDHVLREAVEPETMPSKADVKAAGAPPETKARVAAGLPAGPLSVADKAPVTTHTINDAAGA